MAVLIRSALTKGKARDVITTLEGNELQDYELIKRIVLRVFYCVPETYKKNFRSLRKDEGQTHIDFLRQKEKLFDRWLRSRGAVNDFGKLKNMILLEEFLNCVRPDVKMYMFDRGIEDVKIASKFADKYILTHPQRYNKIGNFVRNV